MRRIFLPLAILFLLGINLQAKGLEDFKKGFKVGLESVKYQLSHEGYQPKIISYDVPYAVIMDIKNVSTTSILYLQHLLYKDGIESITTKDFLLINTYERLVDANELKVEIAKKYDVALKVVELDDGKLQTYPTLFHNTIKTLINDIATDKKVSIVKEYTTPIQTRLVNKKAKAKKEKVTYFSLKNKAMTYEYNYKKPKTNLCKKYGKKRCFDSKSFKELKVRNKGLKWRNGGVYTTPQGEVFQKVYNVNLFVPIADVKN